MLQVLSKESFFETWLEYNSRFPEGVKKEVTQKWRQARPRPGEKETLNIVLREITFHLGILPFVIKIH